MNNRLFIALVAIVALVGLVALAGCSDGGGGSKVRRVDAWGSPPYTGPAEGTATATGSGGGTLRLVFNLEDGVIDFNSINVANWGGDDQNLGGRNQLMRVRAFVRDNNTFPVDGISGASQNSRAGIIRAGFNALRVLPGVGEVPNP